MILRDILTVMKKELRSILKDRVILAQVVLLPFIMVMGYGLLCTTLGSDMDSKEQKPAYVIHAPAFLAEPLKSMDLQEIDEEQAEAIKQQIEDEEASLLMIFPEDFEIAEVGSVDLDNIEIWYNSSLTDSVAKQAAVNAMLENLRPQVFTVNADTSVTYDLYDETAVVRELLSMILPLMILMSVYMVCMTLSAESIAGDKERGFLNTVLMAPVQRSSVAIGKSLTILLVAIVGGLSAFAGMACALPQMVETLSMGSADTISYSFTEYLLLFLTVITAAFVMASVLLVISTLAKSVKQATSIAPVFMLLLIIPGMLSMSAAFKDMVQDLGSINNLIPGWNAIITVQNIIQCNYTMQNIAISCGVNILFSVLCIVVISRLFEKESILNG